MIAALKQHEPQSRSKGIVRLTTVCVLFAIVWGKVLPMIGQWDAVSAWIDPLKAEGIHPDGLYYTDVFTDNRHSELYQ